MSDARPNPIEAANQLRRLARNWTTIEHMIADGASSDNGPVSGYTSTVPAAALMSLSNDIDRFTRFHARCLADEGNWTPRALDTPTLLDGLASRIGHFTNNEDARLAWDFTDELDTLADRAHNAVNPDGRAWSETGHHCLEPDCAGRYLVRINRDNGHTPGWRPLAVCFTTDDLGIDHMTPGHSVDALLVAAASALVAA